MGITARDEKIELPIPWTDTWGNEHETVTGNPVAFHAMRGLAAHSNGFQAIRALSILMSILGTIDRPGGFRHKAPFPRPIPPCAKPPNDARAVQPNTPLDGMPLGWPADPDDLFVNDDGSPVRIDKAFSWEYPLSVHGLMHNVITNAWRGDPYKIDTLMIFMANMAWNSSMNTSEVRKMLNDKDEDGQYKIPFLIVADAFQSETVAYADLVLPDTTYLERHDCMSMLDRPISEFEGPVDSVRIPVLPPTGDCKPFQEVIIELGSRLKLPAFTNSRRQPQVPRLPGFRRQLRNLPRFRHRLPGRLARQGRREVHEGRAQSPGNGRCTRRTTVSFSTSCPSPTSTCATGTRVTWNGPGGTVLTRYAEPINIHIYSEVLQKFRLAAQGKSDGKQPPDHLRKRVETHFDPLPFYSPAAGGAGIRPAQIPAQRHYPATRWRCTTPGIRRTPGCGRFILTTS